MEEGRGGMLTTRSIKVTRSSSRVGRRVEVWLTTRSLTYITSSGIR